MIRLQGRERGEDVKKRKRGERELRDRSRR